MLRSRDKMAELVTVIKEELEIKLETEAYEDEVNLETEIKVELEAHEVNGLKLEVETDEVSHPCADSACYGLCGPEKQAGNENTPTPELNGSEHSLAPKPNVCDGEPDNDQLGPDQLQPRTVMNKMKEALSRVKRGWSINKTSKHLSIPRATLQRWIQVSKQGKRVRLKKGPQTVFSDEQEELIVGRVKTMAKAGFPVSKETILSSATSLGREINLLYKEKEFSPGRKWYESFKKRFPSLSVKTNLERGTVSQNKINSWFNEVELYLKENGTFDSLQDPRRVFNADETTFFLNPKPGKVLAEKGTKTVEDEKQNLTVLLTANAAGEILPPMLLYRHARITLAIAQNIPDSWAIGRSENGWTTQETFYEYIANIFEPWLTKSGIPKPVVFFLDGLSPFMSYHLNIFCKDKGIELVALCPNATHLIQPMDVAVFHTLKSDWREKVAEWRLDHDRRQVQKQDFPVVLEKVLAALPTQTVVNGFAACGLMPWDPKAVKVNKLDKQTSISNYELKIFLKVLEKELGDETVREFQDCRGKWEFPVEKKELFRIWKSATNRESQSKLVELPIAPTESDDMQIELGTS